MNRDIPRCEGRCQVAAWLYSYTCESRYHHDGLCGVATTLVLNIECNYIDASLVPNSAVADEFTGQDEAVHGLGYSGARCRAARLDGPRCRRRRAAALPLLPMRCLRDPPISSGVVVVDAAALDRAAAPIQVPLVDVDAACDQVPRLFHVKVRLGAATVK